MSTATVTVKVALDDESKALLKSTTAALAKFKGGKPPKDEADDTGDDAGDDTDFDTTDDDDAGTETDDAGDDAGDGDDGPSLDDVGEAMKAYATAKGPGGAGSKALAMKVLKLKGGVEQLSKLKPAKFDAVIKACKAATVLLKKKK